ncbi:hypothetical protein ABKN59_011432, partial [Abortiporus biennis]
DNYLSLSLRFSLTKCKSITSNYLNLILPEN